MYSLHNIDCLEHMLSMEPGSVDAILTDLPYGTTACAWDTVIPFEPMWEAVKHVLKPDGAFVTTASQPFVSLLVTSNLKYFKYIWIWDKNTGANFASVNFKPLITAEEILVFSEGASTFVKNSTNMKYNPQKQAKDKPYVKNHSRSYSTKAAPLRSKRPDYVEYTHDYPKNILRIPVRTTQSDVMGRVHPTQKPVALYKYLVQTYTNPGDTVLDMCMGSGTTGVACIETGRDFIGCETDEKHFQTAEKRIEEASLQGQLFEPPSHANNAMNAEQNRCQQLTIL